MTLEVTPAFLISTKTGSSQNAPRPLHHIWVLYQLWRVVGFYPGINHERPATSPVLVFHKRTHAVHVVAGVGAGKNGPHKIIECSGGERAIVYQQDERNML